MISQITIPAILLQLLPPGVCSQSSLKAGQLDYTRAQKHSIPPTCIVQLNLSKTATCGSAIVGLYREVVALQKYSRLQCVNTMLVLFGSRRAGCFSEVAAIYSDHLRKV